MQEAGGTALAFGEDRDQQSFDGKHQRQRGAPRFAREDDDRRRCGRRGEKRDNRNEFAHDAEIV